MAESEETTSSSPLHPPQQVPAQGGTIPPPVAAPSSTPTPAPIAMDVAGPVLSHIAEIASHAEETIRSITHDMDMSTVAYLARRGLGNSPKSLVDLYHLNNLFVHVVEFATSDTVVGYLDGVASDRLEAACNSVRTTFFYLISGKPASASLSYSSLCSYLLCESRKLRSDLSVLFR
jgi:hypothetical protein